MNQTIKEQTQVVSPPVNFEVDPGEAVDKVKQVAKKTIDDMGMNPFLRKITFFSSGGSFLDGYVLSIIGVVNDPTTSGISDSERAMTYETPKKDAV